MKKKVVSILLVVVMILALVVTGCAQKPATESDKPAVKVGFIYVGPIGDGGWTYAHNEGRLFLEAQLKVPTVYKESVPEDVAEVEKVCNDMIDQGVNVIFGTSFGFMDGMEKAAQAHPEVTFLHCSGYKSGDNFLNYFGRMEEPRYLSGIVAGLKTKTNKIGYVAAFNIPEVVRGANAFALGVKSVNKDAVVSVKWTNTWYDPAKEKEAAKALLDEGCDVIAQHQDTAGPQQAAEEKGVWSIGYNTDMKDTAPKAYMTAPIWNWGPYYVQQVKAVIDGTWKSENYLGDLKDGVVVLAPLTENAPKKSVEPVKKAQEEIMAGTLKIFAGPLKDNTGVEKVPAGTVMSDADQYSNFDWFVDNIKGSAK